MHHGTLHRSGKAETCIQIVFDQQCIKTQNVPFTLDLSRASVKRPSTVPKSAALVRNTVNVCASQLVPCGCAPFPVVVKGDGCFPTTSA